MIITLYRARKKMKDFIVPGCLALFTIFFHWIGRIKSKADKADVKKIVKDELRETIKAVEDLQESRQFFKDSIAEIHLYNKLAAEKSKNTRANIQDTLDRQESTFEEFAKEQRDHNKEILKKIGEIVTDQAVMKSQQ